MSKIFKILDDSHPVLKQVATPFNFSNPGEASELAAALGETMRYNYGIGLAAPQVGISTRLFVMGANDNKIFAIFNPEIIERIGEDSFEEGCLSYRGLFLRIKRPETIKVKFQDFNGLWSEQTFSGLTARIFQHEYDHLDGIVFTTKVHSLNLEKAKRKVKKNLKQLAIQEARHLQQQLVARAQQQAAHNEKLKKASVPLEFNIPDMPLITKP